MYTHTNNKQHTYKHTNQRSTGTGPNWRPSLWVCIDACVCMYIRAYMYAPIHIHTHIYINYPNLNTNMYVYTYNIYLYLTTNMYTHTNSKQHTYKYTHQRSTGRGPNWRPSLLPALPRASRTATTRVLGRVPPQISKRRPVYDIMNILFVYDLEYILYVYIYIYTHTHPYKLICVWAVSRHRYPYGTLYMILYIYCMYIYT